MLRILFAGLALAGLAALAPPVAAFPEPHLPCYPDFYGGTVCVVGEEPAPCFTIVSYNPDDRHPQHPVHVSPVYCRDGDARTQVTPCLPGYLDLADPYCWTDYP